ncbi:septal ring lytic transglycosylase RlpA family protein [uncultured Reyranella sp.]|uniref:septal ring lytic transglycosylase RlpA family protein n=1 Tax=uncultured Reyranella sp. TaxID=735512 RepID=UPI00259C758F|nr:septal ring lytic transglycosylase RlpA family protein [uncultured Reyranella sp.]
MPLALVKQRFPALQTLRLCGAIAVMASVAACGSSNKGGGSGASGSAAQAGTYKIGKPYKIDGITYTPQETFTLTETGVASWYGPGFHGKSTANGERYDQSDRTAAHRTLQMPAVVRVTNLDNGLSTVVRVNDRGPFARSRVIDLSRTAAQEIDMIGRGTARVRIDQLSTESMTVKEIALGGGGPAEQQQALAQLASGKRAPAAAPAPAPAPVPAPVPAAPPPQVMQASYEPPSPPPAPAQTVYASPPRGNGTPFPAPQSASGAVPPTIASLSATAPPSSAGGFFVQVGAFSTHENAERQRGAVRSYGNPEVSQGSANGRDVYRVRLGPYTTSDAAGIVADRLKRSGYGDARVVAD